MTGATDSVLPSPIPEPSLSERPASAPFAFELSVSQSMPRETSTTLKDMAHAIAARIPFPLMFVAGAAIGILVASLVVVLSRHGAKATTTASAATTAQVAGPFEPKWAPLPVVTIHPAPPEPVDVLRAPVAADPQPVVDAVPPKAPVAPPHTNRVRRFVRAQRPQPHAAPVSPARDLLADAL